MSSAPAGAKPLELKFGHVGAPGSLFDLSAKEFAKRVNRKMKGQVKILVFGSSQLGKDKALLNKLKLGTVTFSLPSTVMSSVADQFGIFEMPYIIKSRAHATPPITLPVFRIFIFRPPVKYFLLGPIKQ